jgi:hypothetical protein
MTPRRNYNYHKFIQFLCSVKSWRKLISVFGPFPCTVSGRIVLKIIVFYVMTEAEQISEIFFVSSKIV